MEQIPAPSGTGSVLVDIGGDVGAAVIHAPSWLAGTEIEIRRAGAVWEGRHVAVRARRLGAGTIYAAFFEALESGHYEVRLRAGNSESARCSFHVAGGRVTEARLGCAATGTRARAASP